MYAQKNILVCEFLKKLILRKYTASHKSQLPNCLGSSRVDYTQVVNFN